MKLIQSALAAAVVASFAVAPAVAGLLDKKAVKSVETIGPAAKGEKKPYHANVQGTCNMGNCLVSFGKKAKARHIKLITCGVITDEEPLFAAVLFGELVDDDVRFFIPISSVAPQGTGTVGMVEFRFDFDVPADIKIQVSLQTNGTATVGTCTVNGTID